MSATVAQGRLKCDTFPFLEPPEDIRIDIYSLLLGGTIINFSDSISDSNAVQRFSLCTTCFTDNRCFKGPTNMLQLEVVVVNPGHVCIRGNVCSGVRSKPTFPILLVCKKIYLEARLVPFRENTVIFQQPPRLGTVLRSLKPWQAGARRAVTLSNHLRAWTREGTAPVITMTWIKTLTGLRYLKVFIHIGPTGSKPNIDDQFDEAAQDAMVAGMAMLKSENLRDF